jgi:hypothetical protein
MSARIGRRGSLFATGAALLLLVQPASVVNGQFGSPAAELQVVKQFDRNGDGRLDTAERKPAREWVMANGGGGGGGFGRRRFGRFGQGDGGATAGRRVTPADVPVHAQAPLYDTGILRTLFIQFDNEDWAQEMAAFYNTDVEVPATVTVDGQVYRDVGVHFRGASSYRMVPDGAKKSLNLSFDHVHEDQRLRGYRTLNLLNGNGDPSFVRTLLYAEIARHYTPTPKANYMRVVINGESWGAFINVQQFNSDFTRDWFSTPRGARWKAPGSPRGRAGMEYLGEELAPYRRLYEIKTTDDAKSWADLIRMFRTLNETPSEKLEGALGPLLDIDGALKFLALEVALLNSDGYWARASDYSIYQDTKGQFHVLPHDFNEALEEGGGFGFGGGSVRLDPLVGLDDPSKPLRSKLLAVPALRARYLAHVRQIAEQWLDWTTIEPLVRGYQGLVAEELKVDTRKLYGYDAFVSSGGTGPGSLRSFFDRRRAFLLQPLSALPIQ